MEARHLFLVSLLALSFLGAVVSEIYVASSSGAPVVYVDPPLNSAPPDTNFTINIEVANVTNLYRWFFTLYVTQDLYTDKSMIEEGPFLSKNGIYPTELDVNKEIFYWHVGCHIVGTESVDGSGTLATVTFLVKNESQSAIFILDTKLVDPDGVEMDHTTRSGYFSNIRDIMVYPPVFYPTQPQHPRQHIVSVGEPVFMNVTVENHSIVTETFNVTVYYNMTTIGTQTVTSLDPGTQKILNFIWNTTGVADGAYIISANASILEGEFDTDNNSADALKTVTLTLAPAAIFTYSPAYPLVDETVTFNATVSFDPDGNITGYEWDFDDGNVTTVTDPIITHVYTSAGYYLVNLTVTDNDNLTDTELQSVAIGKPNASFTFTPDSPIEGQTVTFDASSSTPRGGTITGYKWDFGDGNITTVTDPTVWHVYTLPGLYTVTLNVTDSEGMWDTESNPITVLPGPPVAAFTFVPESPLVQETVTFNATESKPNGGTIVSYEWNFDDGNITTVPEPIMTHVYETAGNYTVTLNVTDSEEQWDTESKFVTVKAGPEASFSFSPTTPAVNDIVTLNATTSTDPDGTIVSYEWNFGDGNITTVTEPTITHVYKASGNYTVTLKVTDNDSITDTETKSIKVKKTQPNIILYLAVATAIIIAIAAVAVYFIRIRKPS